MSTQHRTHTSLFAACLGLAAASLTTPAQATLVFSSAGANPADIQAQVDAFRADLGALNANVAGSFGTGRREVNWDGVPDNFSSPNSLPANFFNVNSPRGVVFSTPGTGFQVSADSSNPTTTPIEFGHIDLNYPQFFGTFSAQRLFTTIGGNILDVSFFIPGSSTPALTRGFGSVFTDVDSANVTSIEYFDEGGVSLGAFFAQSTLGNETLSFLGVSFDNPIVSRVRITNGNQLLVPGNTSIDLVVMDDFIFAEPVPVPETSTALAGLLTATVLLLARARPRRTA